MGICVNSVLITHLHQFILCATRLRVCCTFAFGRGFVIVHCCCLVCDDSVFGPCFLMQYLVSSLTGAQLRHNDFRIFADPSRIFTYNCDETFKTTSRNLSEKMPGHT